MPPRLALSPPPPARREHDRPTLVARLAVYPDPCLPPAVTELSAPGAAALVESLFAAAAAAAHRLPVLAVREVVENLVHAGFADALVSVLGGGRVLRVSDRGPGIADRTRALEPGVTGAGAAEREVVRGVGCGLPLAAAVMEAAGGGLELADNIGGGTVATISLPADAPDARAGEPPPAGSLPEGARLALALLMEVECAGPERLAAELGAPLARCGRDLVLLEHHALVTRGTDGARRLTPPGTALVETLF